MSSSESSMCIFSILIVKEYAPEILETFGKLKSVQLLHVVTENIFCNA